MANELLKGCKKYIVERVISPSVYCVSEYERGESFKKEVLRFECLMAKDVEKFCDAREILIGQTVAVKDEQHYHRGVVTDIFNRSSKPIYWILLVDYGNIIETDEKNIYCIKNEDLKNRKLSALEVSIHSIKPAVLKVEGDNHFSCGILQKRASGNWSLKAFQFVRDIISKSPYVFVKTITRNKNKRTISGEIYFIEEFSNVPVSLGEKLCAKGFAVSCDIPSKLSSQDSFQEDNDSIIEEKIPNKALSRGIQSSEILKSQKMAGNNGNLNSSSCGSISAVQHQLEREISPSCPSLVSQSQSIDCPSESLNSNSVNYSSSWILKKCQSNSLVPPASTGICKKDDMRASEEGKNMFVGISNESIFKVVLRSMELFNKRKQIERSYCKMSQT